MPDTCFLPRSAVAMACLAAMFLAGCSSLGAAGPGTRTIRAADGATYAGADIAVIDLDRAVNTRIAAHARAQSFAEVFGTAAAAVPTIQRGDTVAITIWEAPPAVLFGTGSEQRTAGEAVAVGGATIPQQRVEDDGSIAIPFVGRVQASGRSAADIQREIVRRLQGRAHDPQVLVRLVDNQASAVTVLGEVATSRRVPLGARGERLLDILAEAGGPTEDVEKITVRLSRADRAVTMPLDAVILDPAQNVAMRAGDVLTVIHQPFTFIALGATGRNAEVPFEGSGLTLAQALGRVGGLRDDRADIRGVFIFRFENPSVLDPELVRTAQTTLDGRVPVVYRLDLSDPAGFFVAQDFAMRDDDVLYVSNAIGTDLQKFLAALSGVVLPTLAVGNAL
jgi:polysaccharide biosynthesis/export protein